ncbi:phosphotransferase [Haloplasma contractile]|uniref:Tyrosine kinase protein n=1 Tax=Haloplasma contractile SSD-17B TaxID=1033810 RepID=F7PTL6_9MOLU|nr:phosphotransferase [Haloplasma contractile]ERJ12180.1 Tyrosine kinase protein [Haloplasma contractile SSD-17B]
MNDSLDWNRWCEVFQDIDYFKPLINRIFIQEQLGDVRQIENVTKGTNAVFKVNDFIVKIFVPDEVKLWKEDDFNTEQSSITRAMNLGVRTPRLVTAGSITDNYVWKYMVLEFIDANEVGKIRIKLNQEQKIKFANDFSNIVNRLNKTPNYMYCNQSIKERVINGGRWEQANMRVQKELKRELENIDLSESVYVHGDLTAENVMMNQSGDVYIIDFADSTIAPSYYEYPPILFDLFDCDKVMIKAFFKNKEKVVDLVYKGLLIHDFGGDFAKLLLKKYKNKSLKELDSLYELKELIQFILV